MDEPSDELIKDIDMFLHVSLVDRVLSACQYTKRASFCTIIDKASTGSKNATDEEDLEQGAFIFAII
jgi:hypothetical protein